MATINEWLAALSARGLEYQRKGDQYQAQCPSHEDKRASLSLKEANDGKVLVNCFASCTYEAVRNALGLARNAVGARNGNNRVNTPKTPETPPTPPKKPQPLPSGQGITVHHYHYENGQNAFAVVRRDLPDGSKRFSQWTPKGNGWINDGPPSPKPLFGLPELFASSGSVVVVEGEKCTLAIRRAWQGQAVTTWAGGANAWHLADWSAIKGRAVTLLADRDEPGRKAMRGIAEILNGLDCKLTVLLPEGDDKYDIADALERGAQAGVDYVNSIKPTPIEDILPKEEAKPDVQVSIDELCDNQHFQLLGMLGNKVGFYIAPGILEVKTMEALTQPAPLQTLAPLVWWERFGGIANAKESRIVGDALLQQAKVLGPFDLERQVGRGAMRTEDGDVIYHLGDRLLADGKETELKHGRYIWLSEPRIELTKPASRQQMADIAEAVMDYRWEGALDGRRMLGWIACALIGGALEWRPHIQLIAPASAGKSWLLKNVVQALMGDILLRIADATPAALSRVTANSSRPVSIDEAEPSNDWVVELLKMLRVASGAEGVRIRADTQSGGVNMQTARFSAMLSSTSALQLNRADESRLSMVRLGEAVEDWIRVSTGIQKAMQHADAARSRIIRNASAIVKEADTIAERLQTDGMDSRLALGTAALTAGWNAWETGDTAAGYVWSQDSQEEVSDAQRALQGIMALRIRLDSSTEMSVLEALRTGNRLPQIADTFGIKAMENADGAVAIARNHPGLNKELSRTPLHNVDITKLLTQISGVYVSPNPLHFGGMRKRAIVVNAAALSGAGIEIMNRTEAT